MTNSRLTTNSRYNTMNTKFTFLLLLPFLLFSFKSYDTRTLKITGSLYDLMTEEAMDSFEITFFGGSWNVPGGLVSCTTDQKGNFFVEVQMIHDRKAINIFAMNFTSVAVNNIPDDTTLDLGKIYMTEFNNEFKHTSPTEYRTCRHPEAHLEGHEITDVIMRTRTKDFGLIAKTDTTELGSSFSAGGDSICWYSFINLYLLKDLSSPD